MKQPLPTTDKHARHLLPSQLVHDLRTPLNQIVGYSEMLAEQAREVGQEKFVPDLEKVRGAGMRILKIIDDNFDAITGPAPTSQATDEEASREQFIAESPLVEPGPGEAGGSLLVVDDEEGNRDMLSRLLEKQGYTVATAENGRQALEMLGAGTYDLVLLDIMMPELDGYDVLGRLKADEQLRHIPVIMVSALSELESVARCIEAGAEDYLPKPFNSTLLKARIGACLEKKRGRDREVQLFQQLQQNYDRLQELEGLRDDLTHMIIHDLRTPLTSVLAAIQTLDAVGEVNQAQREVMEIAVTGADSLLANINGLLDVEKMESGAMDLDFSLLSLPELIASAVTQIRPLAEAKGLTIVQEIAPHLPWLQADEDKLKRVLVNLLGNAIKFTPSGGSVTLLVRQPEEAQAVEFCVRDTGEGIPSEAFERIFEKFGQVESRQSGRTLSTGLGLAFSKLAVEAHGGHIEVESEPDQGSTFSFTVPLSSP
ncbi:MAG: response regulator [Armatimonadota bacterium]|nr:response regulator [Armatimonadota bacterium]